MKVTLRKAIPNLRALCAALLLFSGWLAAPVKLMLPEPPECGQACCLAEGVCCCFTMRASSFEGNHHHSDGASAADSGEAPVQPELSKQAIASNCPAKCASVPSTSHLFAFAKPRAPGQAVQLDEAEAQIIASSIFPPSPDYSDSFSPRAPPISLV
ncbi:MAG: hypothetical protein ACREBD_00740 [Blastocatellia bacterium]